MPNTQLFVQKLTFDLTKLRRGDAVQLISPTHMPNEEPRIDTALIKEISDFKVTLLLSKRFDDFEEQEFPIEAFDGLGSYQLRRLVPEEL